MRILQATTTLRYGSGIAFTELSCRLAADGHQVHAVYSAQTSLPNWPHLETCLRSAGVSIHTIDLFKRDPCSLWRATEKYMQLLDLCDFDLAHLHSGTPAYVDRLAQIKRAATKKLPQVCTLHGFNSHHRPYWMDAMDKYGLSQCERLTAVSRGTRDEALRRGIKRAKVVYPGTLSESELPPEDQDDPDFRDTIRSSGCDILISQVAEISPRKGQLDLVRAAQRLSENRNCQVGCLLVGAIADDCYVRQIRSFAAAHPKLSLFFAGERKQPQRFVRLSHLCVYPSYAEGLGMAIIEGIILGVPTAFSAIEGTRDIAEQLGLRDFAFSLGDEDSMDRAIEKCLSTQDIEKAFPRAASKARTLFSFDTFYRDHLALYHELIASAPLTR